jgi:ribosomal protein S18 acetylase RimI-like enzyme
MIIINSAVNDIATIFQFYDYAIAYQKIKFNKHWQGFDADMVATEINENRQWKIIEGDTVVCVFAVTFNDSVIWGEKADDPAIYIHRIVTHPNHRGKNYVKEIIVWAKKYCIENDKQFIRLDTWGDNEKLINYYTTCGFTFLGLSGKVDSANLPSHYSGLTLSLFEIKID